MSMLRNIIWLTLVITAAQCNRQKEGCFDRKPSNESIFDEKLSKQILQLYPGLFNTAEELKLQLDALEADRENMLSDMGIEAAKIRRLPGDGDQCCATEVNYYTNDLLRDVHGKCRWLVVLYLSSEDHMYQVVPRAKCVRYGHCTGMCLEEYITMTLLVWADPDANRRGLVEFEKFKLPAYCSCKNIN